MEQCPHRLDALMSSRIEVHEQPDPYSPAMRAAGTLQVGGGVLQLGAVSAPRWSIVDQARGLCAETVPFSRDWLGWSNRRGRCREQITLSAIASQLLTYDIRIKIRVEAQPSPGSPG